MKRLAWFALFVIPIASACRSASPAPAVPILGTRPARAQLSGRWEGEYRSGATGRHGTIVFEFSKGPVGHGDVLMMPAGASEPLRPAPVESADETLRRLQVLTIQFVETSEGSLDGALEAYIDPSCSCEVRTTFHGTIRGDRIEGSFSSTPVERQAAETTGEWYVTKSR